MPPEWPAITPRTIVEAFQPGAGAVPAGDLYDLAEAAGIDDQPLRLCLRRMAAAGDIVLTGRGRRGAIDATPAGRERLAGDRLAVRLALLQDEGLAPWDGRWRLLAVSAPESDRAVRDLLRRRLTEAGAAPVSTGLFLTPHDLGGMVGVEHHDRLVLALATEVDVRGETDPLRIAEMLWPAASILPGYAALDELLSSRRLQQVEDMPSLLLAQLHLAEGLERALRPDPLLPPQLRPEGWPPAQIRRRWLGVWQDLAARPGGDVLYRGWITPGPDGDA